MKNDQNTADSLHCILWLAIKDYIDTHPGNTVEEGVFEIAFVLGETLALIRPDHQSEKALREKITEGIEQGLVCKEENPQRFQWLRQNIMEPCAEKAQ